MTSQSGWGALLTRELCCAVCCPTKRVAGALGAHSCQRGLRYTKTDGTALSAPPSALASFQGENREDTREPDAPPHCYLPQFIRGHKAGPACSGSGDLTSGLDTSPYDFPTAGTASPDPSCNRGSPATVKLDDDKGGGQLVMRLS